MIKIIIYLFCFFPFLAFGQREILDKVIAQIGGESVLLSEVEEAYIMEKGRTPEADPKIRCQIMENLLLQKLLTNQAKIDSVVISNDMIENQLNARFDRVLAYMNNDVSQFEAYYGKSVSEMKDELRGDMKDQLLAEEMKNKIVEKITITPSEVKEYYRSIHYDSLPYYNAEVEYSEINYYPQPSKAEKQKVLDKLNSIRTRIVENGEKFEDLAKKFSIDGSAAAGGDLGWAKRGAFVPEFEATAFNLEEGQVSTVIETEFGYHLMQLLERRGNTFHARHILLKPELSDEDKSYARHTLDSIIVLLKTDKLSFVEAVRKYSNKNFPSYSNGGRAINQQSNTNFFEISELDPDIYFTLDTMEVGQISGAIEFKDPYGETAYKVLLLQSRSEPHKANLEMDFSRLKDDAIIFKKDSEIQRWLSEKIANTYIVIQPEWLSQCPGIHHWKMVN